MRSWMPPRTVCGGIAPSMRGFATPSAAPAAASWMLAAAPAAFLRSYVCDAPISPDLALSGTRWPPLAPEINQRSWIARGSINALPFADNSFDAVVSADVLCHSAVDPPVALTELKRVLRPGGLLVMNLPAYQWLLSAHDRHVHNVRRFTAPETAMLLRQAGFDRVRARYWNSLLLPLMMVQRKLLARGDAMSDVAAFPPWLDVTLHGMTRIERHLDFRLPAGGSVLAIAGKP